MNVELILLIAVIAFVLFIGVLVMIAKFFRKVEQGTALIVNTMKAEPVVTFTGRIVIPVIHKAEIMDISVKRLVIDRRGKDGLICKDNIRGDISVNFFVRVNPTVDAVRKVAGSIGCNRASDETTLNDLFAAKFAEALKTVGKQMEFEELYQARDAFRDAIKRMVGDDLNGYSLEDVAIDYLEQTPIAQLDDSNILDAQGIRKITELTATQRVAANDARRNEEKQIRKQDVEAREAVLALDRQQAEAEAKQRREIETVQSREQAAAKLVSEEERLRMETARIRADQDIAIQEENKRREVEVTEQERLKILGIKQEEVDRFRQVEIVAREKEVALKVIEKEKALEVERKAIADVVRERVAVEKTVAVEEEKIKEVRAISEASRQKQVRVTAAEAEAEEGLVKELKRAEADEKAARFEAQKRIALAEAELEASAKLAESKKVLAEGSQAETAAPGLAEARVKEALAVAAEKQGKAEANVTYETLHAQAKGEEERGMVRVRVQEAEAKVIQEKGFAEARVKKEGLLAGAEGEKAKGLALVEVQRAEADAIEARGHADASAILERYKAESQGLKEKFQAISGLDEGGRMHEEFRLQLEKQKEIELSALDAHRQLGEAQAQVLGEAFKSANINIVGGDGAFFDRMVNAISSGKSLDAVVNHSKVVQEVAGPYLSGDKDILADIKDILTNAKLSSADLQNLTVSAVLAKLLANGDANQNEKVNRLIAKAKELGLG